MAKWGSCDFSQIKKLQKQIEAVEKGKDAFCRQRANELAQRLLYLVKKRTPKGKAPKIDGPKSVKVKVKGADGKTRTRSFLTADAARIQQHWAGYTGGELRRNWTAGKIRKAGDLYEIEVINQVFYASYVEYGHRQTPGKYVPAIGKRLKKAWVPGKFMMTISVQELQTMAPARLERMVADYLKECLKDV